jgi:signal transduction histidine kinase
MSKIEAGRMSLEESSFDLREMLSSILKVFELKRQRKGVSISSYWEPMEKPG